MGNSGALFLGNHISKELKNGFEPFQPAPAEETEEINHGDAGPQIKPHIEFFLFTEQYLFGQTIRDKDRPPLIEYGPIGFIECAIGSRFRKLLRARDGSIDRDDNGVQLKRTGK